MQHDNVGLVYDASRIPPPQQKKINDSGECSEFAITVLKINCFSCCFPIASASTVAPCSACTDNY